MRAAGAALAVAGVLALCGCTSSSTVIRGETPAPSATAPSATAGATAGASPAPTSTATPVASVVPKPPADFTELALASESKRTADAIQALIDPAAIVHVDDHSQVVAKSDGSGHYYGILRTITLAPATDATDLARSMTATLLASGWLSRNTQEQGEIYLAGLASSKDDASSWFLVVGGDDSTKGQSVLSLQMASPDTDAG